jgi:signal transduction histidine kinase
MPRVAARRPVPVVLSVALLGTVALAYLASLPASYARRIEICSGAGCPVESLAPGEVAALSRLGLTPAGYAVASLALVTVVVGTYLVVAALLVRVGGDRPEVWWSAAVLVAVGVVFAQTLPALVASVPALGAAVAGFEVLAMAAFMTWLLTFPDGRLRPRWSVWLIVVVAVADAADRLGLGVPGPVEAAGSAVVFGGTVGVLILRFRRFGPPVRRQAAWVLAAFGVALVALVLATVAQLGFGVRPGSVADLVLQVGIVLAFLLVPVAVVGSVLRRGLFDVGAGLARATTYAVLSALAMGGYLLLAAVASALSVASTGLAVVAAALLAVGLHPAYLRVLALVNRALYGSRQNPAELLARLARPTPTGGAAAMLVEATETLRRALRLPYAEVAVGALQASTGELPSGWPVETFALSHDGAAVGRLRLGARDPDGRLDAHDQAVLAPVLAQLGLLAHAALLDDQLRSSRRELVSAREEERRRLRNDLHDGIGPALGAIGLSLSAAGNHLDRDPESARRLLDGARRQTSAVLVDVRRLVYGLRPPSLDELGLPGALRAFVRGLESEAMTVGVVEPPGGLPPLPAAVEVAAYRIVIEAVSNAVRHSTGTRCTATLSADDDGCRLEICDDGQAVPAVAGVGLTSLRDRAEELGGTATVTMGPNGTRVLVVLPLGEVGDDD